jgi:hypothetical protein
MNSKGKYIGINQRIPFDVLDGAIHLLVENEVVDRASIMNHMLEYTSGVNRASKATNYVIQILNRQSKLIKHLGKALNEMSYTSLGVDDRKAFCLCLISLTYPITYDLLVALSQGYKVQTHINKTFISEKVKSIYGSNRTVDVAIDALLPMIIELKTIKREKLGLYSHGDKLVVTQHYIDELVIYTDIRLSGSKSILIDDLESRAWYTYFDRRAVSVTYGTLVSKKDSVIGKGYLTVNSV